MADFHLACAADSACAGYATELIVTGANIGQERPLGMYRSGTWQPNALSVFHRKARASERSCGASVGVGSDPTASEWGTRSVVSSAGTDFDASTERLMSPVEASPDAPTSPK